MIEIKNTKKLLTDVRRMIKHHKEVAKLKGESFNVFSILNMESKENGTHSAFLAELLNPTGSHNMGALFLELFINEVKTNKKPFEPIEAKVITEKFIGKRNDKDKSGGRIDIYLEDKNKNVISIENKIYAGDQTVQIERYCNHKTSKNTVYYLTLDGSEASEDSKGELEAGNHYFTISYATHIVKWLGLCLKEAAEQPILRESIKQYIILIKKLTNTMSEKDEKEISKLIIDNLDEAQFITKYYEKTLVNIRSLFKDAVFKELEKKLDVSKFTIVIGNPVTNKYSQIWVYIKGFENTNQHFGIESFSGRGYENGEIFVGIYNNDPFKIKICEDKEYKTPNRWWPAIKMISNYNNEIVNLANFKLLKLLNNQDSKEFKGLVEHICKESIDFINSNEASLKNYLEKNTKNAEVVNQ